MEHAITCESIDYVMARGMELGTTDVDGGWIEQMKRRLRQRECPIRVSIGGSAYPVTHIHVPFLR